MKRVPQFDGGGGMGHGQATLLLQPPADSAVERAARLGMSPDHLRRVRSRLQRLLLVMLVVVSLSFLVTILIGIGYGRSLVEMRDMLVGTFVTVVVTAAGYWVLRNAAIRDDLAVWVGFAMEFFLAASAAMGNYTGYYAQYGHMPMIPWTVGVMLIFPLVLPRPPKLALAMATLSGACIPYRIPVDAE